MLTLGVETSGREGSIAACSDDDVLCSRSLEKAGRRHAQTLVSELKSMLDEEGLSRDRIDSVAVSIGPGSFTGLRVGVVFAKTFAWSTGARLVAVDTFRCIAENAPDDVDNMFVVSDAQRGDVFVNRYQRGARTGWHSATAIEIVNVESWAAGLVDRPFVSGPGLTRYSDVIGERAKLLPDACRAPSAKSVATLGRRSLGTESEVDAERLEPFYLRRSSAEEKWEQRETQA